MTIADMAGRAQLRIGPERGDIWVQTHTFVEHLRCVTIVDVARTAARQMSFADLELPRRGV
jgi:hypothetical protein